MECVRERVWKIEHMTHDVVLMHDGGCPHLCACQYIFLHVCVLMLADRAARLGEGPLACVVS